MIKMLNTRVVRKSADVLNYRANGQEFYYSESNAATGEAMAKRLAKPGVRAWKCDRNWSNRASYLNLDKVQVLLSEENHRSSYGCTPRASKLDRSVGRACLVARRGMRKTRRSCVANPH